MTAFHQPVLITEQACKGDLSPARETCVQTCQPWGLGRPSTFHPSEFPAPEPSPTANVLPSQSPRHKQLPLSQSARGRPPAHRFRIAGLPGTALLKVEGLLVCEPPVSPHLPSPLPPARPPPQRFTVSIVTASGFRAATSYRALLLLTGGFCQRMH